MLARILGASWLFLCVGLIACGSDDEPASPSSGGSAGSSGSGGMGGNAGSSAIPGTSAAFDLAIDLDDPDSFYELPYPNDLRLSDKGTPRLEAFPNPSQLPSVTGVVDGLKILAVDRPGFPSVPVAYFHFDAELAPQDPTTTIVADKSSPILLIDIDESSPERGRLYATIAQTLAPDGLYVPEHLLAIASHPGIVLPPKRKYAFVVMRGLNDAAGSPLGVPAALLDLKAGVAPAAPLGSQALPLYASLWTTLEQLGVDVAEVAAATVFSTGDVVEATAELSTRLVDKYDVTIEDLVIDPDDGASHPRFCEILASVKFPQFQQGAPPFNDASQGRFSFGSDGLPVEQRQETAPVVISLPKQPMPAGGYPLVMYFHGSGGLAGQVVDRGRVTMPGGEPTKGEGPAHVLAAHGFASVGSAHPLNPERLPGAGETEYLNFNNLSAFRDTFRQGVIEQRLLIEALSKLEIPASVVSGCTGMSLPAGETAYHFATTPLLATGQSMGGMYTNMIGATEPRIEAVVPTGAGGFWSLFIVQTKLIGNLGRLAAILMGLEVTYEMSHLHPTLSLLQTGWEPADPMVYMPRLGRRPLPSHPARPVYEPVGKDDSYFPTTLYDAIVLAYGHEQAGDVVWPTMQTALKVEGLDGIVPYDVKQNLMSGDGTPFTGVVVQYEGDGIYDPHGIYGQLDEVKYQYGCFFESFLRDGAATVPAPAALGTPCP